MLITILITDDTISKTEELLSFPLPSSIKDLWRYFQKLGECLWKIRSEINEFIDAYPTKNGLPVNFRNDPRFDDTNIKQIENNVEKRMSECSEEAKRIEKEKERIALRALRGE